MNDDFVIIGSNRTGTTMLNSALNNCIGISSFGECLATKQRKYSFLNSDIESIKQLRNHSFKHSLFKWYKDNNKECDNDIQKILNEKIIESWLDWLFKKNNTVGFKLLWNTINKFNKIGIDIPSILNKKNIKVIYISRNPINRAISIKNKWRVKKSINELVEETLNEQKDLKNWFPNRLDITYEELTNNLDVREFPKNVSIKIFDYLELHFQSLKPTIKKTIYLK